VRLQRTAVLLVAIPVLVWLGVSYENARLVDHGRTVLENPHASRAQIEAALADVRRAHRLDPKRTESLSFAAALEIRAGRLDAASRLFEEVVRREPDTPPEAWLTLAELTQKSDPALSARARAQARRLDPLDFGPPR
jgi:cytochrome c-type biogenesis protein CcmH/NrfG